MTALRTLGDWRKSVLERDGHRCTKCGSTTRLHTHHIEPAVENPEQFLELDNGVTLCSKCHAKTQKRRKSKGISGYPPIAIHPLGHATIPRVYIEAGYVGMCPTLESSCIVVLVRPGTKGLSIIRSLDLAKTKIQERIGAGVL